MPDKDKRTVRKEARTKALREDVIKAAMELLARSAEPAMTMEEIADQAELSTATLYKVFPGKRHEINAKLIEHALKVDKEHLDEAFGMHESPVDELTAVGSAYLNFGLEYPGYFQVVAQPANFGFDLEQARLLEERVNELVDRVADVVRRGQSHGAPGGPLFPDAKLDAGDIAQVLHGAWNGLIALSLRSDALQRDGTQLNKLAVVATTIVRRGLLSPRDQE